MIVQIIVLYNRIEIIYVIFTTKYYYKYKYFLNILYY